MGRPSRKSRKSKGPAKLRGHLSWAVGSKKIFLEHFSPEYITAHQDGHDHASTFYDKVTTGFFCKYGFDLPFNKDFDGPEPTEDLMANILDFTGLNEDQVAA